MSVHVQNSRMTTTRLRKMKQEGEKIAMLTSYDFTLTRLLDQAGIEMILVGDSASNIVCGNRYTLPITVEEMIFLTKGVVRAAEHALVVIDMPFGSYQVSEEQAVTNALKMMKESGADAVKLEGGEEILPAIRHMVQAGVPVMGHLGLTPQSVNQLGGYGLRGKGEAEAEKLLNDAKLTSPISGEVATISLNEGELTSIGTSIMTILDIENPYLVLNVREDLLQHFQMGETILCYIPALGLKEVPFIINHISPLGSFAT